MTPTLLLVTTTALAGTFGEVGAPAMRPEIPEGKVVDPYGELRLLASLPPRDLQLDTDGTMLGQDFVLDSRLRAGLAFGKNGWRGVVEGDLFDGQLAGDAWDIPGAEDARERERVGVLTGDDFDLRRAFVKARLGVVGLQAGVATSHWGLGMLANDGNRDPVFGRNDFGDRVIRLQLASRPFGKGETPLTFSLAGDRVIEDEFARWTPFQEEIGQVAWQGIGAVMWEPEDAADVGFYAVHRRQTEDDGERTTTITALDLYADWTTELSGVSLRLAGEGATLLGSTDRALSYNERERLAVRSGGVTGLLEVDLKDSPLRGILRGGWPLATATPTMARSTTSPTTGTSTLGWWPTTSFLERWMPRPTTRWAAPSTPGLRPKEPMPSCGRGPFARPSSSSPWWRSMPSTGWSCAPAPPSTKPPAPSPSPSPPPATAVCRPTSWASPPAATASARS